MVAKKSKPSRQKFDPLQYEHSRGAQAFGSFSYRMRYDMAFAQKVNTFQVVLIAVVLAVMGAFQTGELQKYFYYGAAGVLGLAVIYYFAFPTLFRYDIGSTVAYCRRQLGTRASDKAIRKCVERRENLEDMR